MTSASDNKSPSLAAMLSRLAGMLSAAVGVLVIFGWILDIGMLKSVAPGFVTMKANTALCFVFAGAALWLLQDRQPGRGRRLIPLVLSGIVIAVGVLTLAQYLFGWNLHVDELLFDDLDTFGTAVPGRMAPTTALNFVLIGIGLLRLGVSDSKTKLAQIASLVVLMISLFALVGYVYGVESLYRVQHYTPMALHTAVTFSVLVLGILAARPNDGVMKILTSSYVGSVFARRVLPAAVALPLLLGWIRLKGQIAGLYGTEFGVTVMVTLVIALLVPFVLITAHSLNRSDAKRKRFEEELHVLSTSVNAAANAIMITDRKGDIQSVNPAFTLITGYSSEEVLGRNPRELVKSGIHKRDFYKRLWETILAGKVWRGEMINRRKDGTLYTEEQTITPLLDEHGNVINFIAIKQDITDRSRAAEAIRESEKQLREAQRIARTGNWAFDLRTNEIRWSEQVFRLFERDMSLGPPTEEEEAKYYTEEEAKALRDGARRSIEKNVEVTCDFEPILSSGRKAYYTSTMRPEKDESGRTTKLLGTVQDITERKRAEAVQSRLAAIVEGSTDAIIGKTLEGVVTIWNAAAEQMFGYTAEEMVGRPVAPVIPLDHLTEESRLLSQIARGERVDVFETVRTHKDGRRIEVSLTISPIKDAAGIVVGASTIVHDITERIETEREKAALLARDQALIDALAEIVYDRRPKTNELLWEGNYTRILGYSVEEMGRDTSSWTGRVHPDDMDRVSHEVQRAELEGRSYDLEYRFRRRDGSYAWMHDRGVLTLDAEGKLERILGVFRDITGRMQVEERIRNEKLLSDSLINSLPGVFYLFDNTGTFLRWNKEFEIVSGYSYEEISTMNPQDFFADEEKISVSKRIQEVFEKGEATVEAHFVSKHGTRAPYYFSGKRIDINGRPCLLGMGIDITARKRAEDSLIESEKRFRSTFDNAAVGVTIVSPEGKWLRVNEKLCSIVGYSEEELLQLTFQDITHPDDLEADLNLVRKVLANEIKTYTLEKRYIRKDRSPVWISLTVSLVRTSSGEPAYFIAIVEDISDRNASKEEILRLNAELEERVRQRTAQLQASNDELEAFSYSVSHDLRAPLRAIDGFSLALLEDYGRMLDNEGKENLSRVRNAAQRMATLIDDMLNLSRISRSKMNVQTVDVSALVREIAEELRQREPDRIVRFTVPLRVEATIDPSLARMLFDNLLSNAWKFTSKHPAAEVEFGTSSVDANTVYFIRDNGAGFDMQFADKLFSAFQRLHGTDEFPGMGIGLATVRRIVHRHGGRVWAEGRVGEGAIIYFTLG